MRRLATLAITLAASLAGSGAALATAWNMPASSCPIVVGADLAAVSGATVSFAPGRTGTIMLMCPVTDVRYGLAGTDSTLSLLSMSWLDSTGTGDTAVVAATLKRTAFTSAAATTMASFKSNQFVATGQTSNGIAFPDHAFDFGISVYHVEIVLKRLAPTETVSVTGVRLGVRRRPPNPV